MDGRFVAGVIVFKNDEEQFDSYVVCEITDHDSDAEEVEFSFMIGREQYYVKFNYDEFAFVRRQFDRRK